MIFMTGMKIIFFPLLNCPPILLTLTDSMHIFTYNIKAVKDLLIGAKLHKGYSIKTEGGGVFL